MGQTTKIEWCDGSFNPVLGCLKIQPECTHCFAEVETFPRVMRGRGLELWGPPKTTARHVTGADNWKMPMRLERKAVKENRRVRLFCASMSDVFEDHPTWLAPRDWLITLIEMTPHIDWLLLTKRPGNMVRFTRSRWSGDWPKNVWAGTSGGTQKSFDENTAELKDVPAAVKFVSCEPLLASTRLGNTVDWLHWVIGGGESGPNARECDVQWMLDLGAECKEAGIPFFPKQLGSKPVFRGAPYEILTPKGGDLDELPAAIRKREHPKSAAA